MRYFKENVKFLILMAISLVIIGLNVSSILQNRTEPRDLSTYRRPVNPLSFYDKECIPFSLISIKGDNMCLPDGKNHLVIGLNELFDRDAEILSYQIKTFDFTEYNIDVIAATLAKKLDNDYGLPVYRYKDNEIGNFFRLSDNKNFTFIVDENNRIKFFKYEFLDLRELFQLLEKYKKTLN